VELGMIPVLPTFAGHVPDAIDRLYPNANVSILSWSVFNCTYTCIRFIEPTDPLFHKIGSMFMKEMKREFGLYHAYSADPFNEMASRSYEQDYLDAVGKAIYNSMTAEDPDAVWVMQGWMFIGNSHWWANDAAKNLLLSVPIGKLLILDLYSEQIPVYGWFESFYGQTFIWNVLHDFGGASDMFGSVSNINNNIVDATQYPNSTLVGVGLTMEGIYQNYPIYQFTWDRAWSSRNRLDQSNWIIQYAKARYGVYDEHIEKAWHTLWTTVYDENNKAALTRTHTHPQTNRQLSPRGIPANVNVVISYLLYRPALIMDSQVGYSPQPLCNAWKLFVHRSSSFKQSDLFRLDLVDITREALMLIAGNNYRLLVKAYSKKDLQNVIYYGTKLVQIFDDLEQILATHDHFLLGRWIKQARANGKTDEERDQYEYNIRNLVTLWGPTGVSPDYARKEWAGLMGDYYKPRWLLFTSMLVSSLHEGAPPFSQASYNDLVFTMVEQPFTFKKSTHPDEPIGDSVKLAKEIHDKYAIECQAVAKSL